MDYLDLVGILSTQPCIIIAHHQEAQLQGASGELQGVAGHLGVQAGRGERTGVATSNRWLLEAPGHLIAPMFPGSIGPVVSPVAGEVPQSPTPGKELLLLKRQWVP